MVLVMEKEPHSGSSGELGGGWAIGGPAIQGVVTQL